MSIISTGQQGERHLVMGNEAIARGALEAGVNVAAAYPGTPSSEILENLAKVADPEKLYVEWSINEKVAAEVAAAASFAGLRGMAIMKQNGVNVASDFLLHLAGSGCRGGLVLMVADDPGALSSANEGESRHFARLLEIPLFEPATFQEAKDMVKWAFELSEELQTFVMMRSVTRLSHASGNVVFGEMPETSPQPKFVNNGFILDQMTGIVVSAPVQFKHPVQQQRLKTAIERFEASPYNIYTGPENPELLIITSSACSLYSKEAVRQLNVEARVGILKLGTTWPLPKELVKKHLMSADKILFVEEVIEFLEDHVKILAADSAKEIGAKTFYGKTGGQIPSTGELNPDIVTAALASIVGIDISQAEDDYHSQAKSILDKGAPVRDMTFCPGCPHRGSFWTIHNVLELDGRSGFVCGDIGCYTMAVLPSGFSTLKTVHSMGSGTGVASGFGKLEAMGLDQPVLAVCGDSTFFHAAMPALVNAVHNRSNITLIILDNSGTGMTGFQLHPGLPADARGGEVPAISIEKVCRAIGANVEVCDPFDIDTTQSTLLELMNIKKGTNVLILRQICALSPEKKNKKMFEVTVGEDQCRGENCGCNRLCTRIFKCPGLVWDETIETARIDEVLCAGCGFCANICPAGAISLKEAR